MDVGFAAEPGELALGVVAMALLGGVDGCFEIHGSVEDGEGLTVAQGFEGSDWAVLLEQAAGFFYEAGLEHGFGALIEMVVQGLARWVESDAEEAEAG